MLKSCQSTLKCFDLVIDRKMYKYLEERYLTVMNNNGN